MAWKMTLRLPILQGAPIKSNDAKQLVDKGDNLALYLANYQESRDGQLLFEVEMYLQKGCITVSGVESS